MLKRLHLRNFTVFADAEFEFGNERKINVLVGANGMGKSHLLKAGYAVDLACATTAHNQAPGIALAAGSKMHDVFDEIINHDLNGQFPGNTLSNLVRRPKKATGDIPAEAEVQAEIIGADGSLIFFIKADKTHSVFIEQVPVVKQDSMKPVFIPAREVLTLGWLLDYNHFGEVKDDAEIEKLPIDRTYLNLLRQLSKPPLESHDLRVQQIIEQVRQVIKGDVRFERGQFYVVPYGQSPLGINLVAEGMRKFATLYKLLANGTLTPETTLFWDEPEANLNPALLKDMAVILTDLAQAGFQIILATHSLFLMKELHILAQEKKAPVRYFGLSAQPGEAVTVATADNLELLPDIVALDAELEQTDRFQRVLDQEDANRN